MGALAGAVLTRWQRFRRWWRSTPARLDGTHIAEGESLTALGVGATFVVDTELVQRQIDARAKLGPVPVEARKTPRKILRLVETHPDASAVHVAEDFNLPIG